MDLAFERGDPLAPKGHALLYFRETDGVGKLYSTYIIVLPIPLDFVKYMPPLLADQLPNVNSRELRVFALPPMPEEAGGQAQLEALAEARGDDLVFGGDFAVGQVQDMLLQVQHLAEEYEHRYQAHIGDAAAAPEPVGAPEALGGLNVNEVLFELMSDRDRPRRARQADGPAALRRRGQRRAGGCGTRRTRSACSRATCRTGTTWTRCCGRPRTPRAAGGDLAQLYLERCYKLADEDYPSLAEIEERIRGLEAG